ncbi:hypothetical protein PsW64_00373 [Pseudovibrio sp. W64]|nr:hypothetical protein PsW64_00373 [Pseudovibrio sp. W64]
MSIGLFRAGITIELNSIKFRLLDIIFAEYYIQN